MIIDGTDLIIGRAGTKIAKLALEGVPIDIINCDHMVLTGRKRDIIEKYKSRRSRGEPFHGPFYPKTSDRLVRRAIRGMLPYKKERGKEAFKRIRCFIGVPIALEEKMKKDKPQTIQEANISKVPNLKYIKISTLSMELGGAK